MTHPISQPARGVLKEASSPPFTHERISPDARLADLVEFFWSVRWDLPAPHTFSQRVLSHPSVHIVWEPERMYIAGIPTACFVRTLQGQGDVFSAKLLPGHVSRLLPGLARDYTDAEILLRDVLDARRVDALHAFMQSNHDVTARVDHFTAFLHAFALPGQPSHDLAERITSWIAAHPEALRVHDVCAHFGIHERALQRLFAQHVGISPRWIIGRYRMHEAAVRLEAGDEGSLTTLAHDLGYFDQAHFTRDFKNLTGDTPSSYRSRSSPDAGAAG